jgi:phage virion morphogenesis protein
MPAGLRITVEGQERIERALLGVVRKFEDASELMAGIGLYLESATIERFDRETAPDGSKWKQSIRAREEGGKTLTDSSQLRSSITSNSTARSVEVGTNKIYAGVHQFGIDKKVNVKAHNRTIEEAFGIKLAGPVTFNVASFSRQMKMPARPFLGINAEDEVEILALTEDFFALETEGTA